MDINAINAKLEALKAQQNNPRTPQSDRPDILWKPEPGKQTIRIVPDQFNPSNPFTELSFYYEFGGTKLAPSTFGKPDPVVEYCNALIDPSRGKIPLDEWRVLNDLKKKLAPKQRTYVPVIVRGKEHEGVKFWAFGQRVYTQLLEICADPEYGSIDDLERGTDLTIEFTPGAEAKDNKTGVLPKRNVSKVSDDPAVLELIKGMPNIRKHYTEPTYDELKDSLKKYLSGDTGKKASSGDYTPSGDDNFKPTDLKLPVGPDGNQGSKPKVDISDIEAAFDEAFN